MADPHEDAAGDDQGGGGETELLGTEQGGDDDIATGLDLAVDLDDDPVPQAVEDQGLLVSGEPELPGAPACLRLVNGDAPVPPSWPEMRTTSACALGDPPPPPCPRPPRRPGDVDPRARVGVLEVVDGWARSSIE